MTSLKNKNGMTLIEVMVALAIFTVSFMVIIDAQNMNIRNSAISRKTSVATMLAQRKLAEIQLKYRDLSLSEITEKEEGKFKEPYEKFRWEVASRDFKYDLSFLVDLAKQQMNTEEGSEFDEEDSEEESSPILKFLPKISKFIQDSAKEVTLTVYWKSGSQERKLSITMHFYNYQTPFNI